MLSLLLTVIIAALGYAATRNFVQDRLRFVDAAQSPMAPIIAGIGAAIIALPVVALLPLVTTVTAVAFGAAVGIGVASGARAIRRRLGSGS